MLTGAIFDLLTSDGICGSALMPYAGNSCKHIRCTLHCTALHVVLDGSDTTKFFAAACAPRTTVNQMWHWRTVPGRGLGGLTVEHMETTMVRRYTQSGICNEAIVV